MEAYINYGVNWSRCNDDKLGIANKYNISSKHNYIFLHYKIDKTSEFVPTKFWEQDFPSQATQGGLQYKLDSSTGKNFAKLFDVPTAGKLSR